MKIDIEPGSGFCFGVRRAIDTVEKYLPDNKKLYSLGEIVHNHEEIERLEALGLQNVIKDEISNISNHTVLIRTHGEPPSTYKTLKENNNKILDATCPVVLKLQDRIKSAFENISSQDGQIVIIGKKGHAEVVGLAGQTQNNAVVISKIEDLEKVNFDNPVEVFSQTTFPLEDFHIISAEIKARAKSDIKIHDTICRQVANRVPRLREFSAKYDVVIFVSGKNSSNGNLLFNECLKINPQCYFISKPEEIKPEWLSDIETIGITGATSTPRWLMENVRDHVTAILNIKE